jgi:hypothetical protein
METADEEILNATLDAMDRSVKVGKPFFIWHNTTRMHIWTHLQQKYADLIPEKGLYGAGMTEFDDNIGAASGRRRISLGRCRAVWLSRFRAGSIRTLVGVISRMIIRPADSPIRPP